MYGELSSEFSTGSSVRQRCAISPFLFDFVMDALLESSLSWCFSSGIELLLGGELTNLEYADDMALLSDDPGGSQAFLDGLADSARKFGMCFAPSECEILFPDWSDATPGLMLADEVIVKVDRFVYFGSRMNLGGHVADEVSARM